MGASIEEQVAALTARVAELEAFVAALKGALGGGASGGGVATDRELDGQYGDPQIKYDPRDWKGTKYVGKTFSQTTPEYLEFLAEGHEDYARYLRGKGDPKSIKAAGYREKDARLARGWMRRMAETGWTPPAKPAAPTNPWAKPPPPQSPAEDDLDSEIPF